MCLVIWLKRVCSEELTSCRYQESAASLMQAARGCVEARAEH